MTDIGCVWLWQPVQTCGLHSRFVPWDHSCGRCRTDWEQLFCAPISSYRRWHWPHSGDGQRGTLLSLNSVCSRRVGTKSPQTEQRSASILGRGREGCGRRCQTERGWWQDTTRSWSHSHRTHGAINYTEDRVDSELWISVENALIYGVEVRADMNQLEMTSFRKWDEEVSRQSWACFIEGEWLQATSCKW